MPAKKLFKFKDGQVDRQIEEVVHYLNKPQCPLLAEYANNAAAVAAGLVAGQFYRTSTGVLMVVY